MMGEQMQPMGKRRQFLVHGASLIPAFLLPFGLIGTATAQEKQATLVLELDLSTRTRDAGRAIEDGVRAALQRAGTSMPIRVLDTQGNLVRAIDGLTDIATAEPILAIIGGGDGNVSSHVMEWAEANQVPYGIAWASNLSAQRAARWSFSLGFSDARSIAAAVKLARLHEKRRWGFLLSNDALGRANYDTVLELMAAPTAPELVGIQWHDVFAHNIGVQYLRLQQQGAQAIWLSGHPRAARQLADAMQRQMQIKALTPVIASSSAWNAEFNALAQSHFDSVPLYFELPESEKLTPGPAGQSPVWMHPANTNADELLTTMLQATHKKQQDLSKQRAAIARAWTALQSKQRGTRMALYRYNGQGQLMRTPPSRVFA
jgi:ABC-type branched-subunit amino acid transport system substrate-binding protein